MADVKQLELGYVVSDADARTVRAGHAVKYVNSELATIGPILSHEESNLVYARLRDDPEPTPRASISDRFEVFIKENPHVMVEMLRLARERMEAGKKRIGVKALWEELRETLRVKKLGEWKLDNSFTALAARKLIELDPRLEKLIEVRRRKAK